MTRQPISFEETAALGLAVVLHVMLAAALLLQPETREPPPPIERVTVNLSEEAGMQSTAPDPVKESRAATAPILSDNPAPVFEPSQPLPAPQQVATSAARAAVTPEPRPRATTLPQTRPVARPTARPTQRPSPRASRPESRPASRPSSQATSRPSTPAARSGGSQIGDNFLEGAGTSRSSAETRIPASQIGASARSSLLQALSRQLKPHWSPPDGLDKEKIVSVVSFSLNPDGSLSGTPRLRSQSGINDTNRAQAARHGEQAVRAVQLAAPFDLPANLYEGWKRATISFDWKLSQ